MTLAIKPHFAKKKKPTFYTDSIRLAYALTATDMRMHENDVTLGIPKTSSTFMLYSDEPVQLHRRPTNRIYYWN